MEFFLSNSEYTLPYRVYGHGSKSLIAFHGFGRSGEDFREFGEDLCDSFTLYAFDLPYHGKAEVHSKSALPALTMSQLETLILAFCKEKNINRFSLMGYSLGGKVALACAQVLPDRVDHLWLLAPDGLKINPFYWMGTRSWVGSLLFKSIIRHPALLLITGNILEKTGLLNPKINHFVRHHMDTVPKRSRVFQVWMLFRKCWPDLKIIGQNINTKNIRLQMFFGLYDSVIPPRMAQKLVHYLKDKEVLNVIRHGHKLMEKHEEISRVMLKNAE